jgi:poly(3-hydroxybutyrate) depolymerase
MESRMSLAKRCSTVIAIFIVALSTIGCAAPLAALESTATPAVTPNPAFTLQAQAQPYERDQSIAYLLYLPPQYTPDRAWPLFVGLHGYGGNARDCLNAWQSYADEASFVLACPSLNDPYGGWEQDVMKNTLHEVIAKVQSEVHVKPRAFVAGFSAGGHLAQRYAWAYPKDVGAVAVLSAVTYDQPEAQAKAIPFLITLGDADHLGGVKQVQQFTQDLQQAGFIAELHILPDVGHTVTDDARRLTLEFFKRTMSQ